MEENTFPSLKKGFTMMIIVCNTVSLWEGRVISHEQRKSFCSRKSWCLQRTPSTKSFKHIVIMRSVPYLQQLSHISFWPFTLISSLLVCYSVSINVLSLVSNMFSFDIGFHNLHVYIYQKRGTESRTTSRAYCSYS